MKLGNGKAEIFVPDGRAPASALKRITHLGIGAHQDDLEFMAFHGIKECFNHDRKWFGGITCTNGSGSARSGRYEHFTDAQMMAVRREEQNNAARIGQYGIMIQLGYTSGEAKNPDSQKLKNDLAVILDAAQPEIVYTHNLADKHETHVGVAVAAVTAMRELPAKRRPRQVIGCEVWRALDWLDDDRKVVMDVSGHDHLAAALNGVFDSQIGGGKRYDLGTHGRRAANATFFQSHATDRANQLIFGMDLTPLVADASLDIAEFVGAQVEAFAKDVRNKLNQRLGRA
jgi:LmbE family N-acetylglucosaminyl deacetylase